MSESLRVEPGDESYGSCACCGNDTRTIWGYIHAGARPIACYWVQWTKDKPEHLPNFDFLVGTWGDDTVSDKKLISWIFNPALGGGSFMVIDSATRPAAKSPLCNAALSRDQVIGDGKVMDTATDLIDAVWLSDPRLADVREFAQ